MRKNAIKTIIIVGVLFSVVTMSVFAETGGMGDAGKVEIIPISHTKSHWAEEYVERIASTYNIESFFEDKNLNDSISSKEFQNLISLTIDEDYTNILESMTREEAVNELVHIWADKTDNKVEEIPTIKMIVYRDMEEINSEYNHSITVAYMKGIASGKGKGIFAPKAEVTYGEAAAMIVKLESAIEKEMEFKEGEKIFKTIGDYKIKDGNMIFNFELKNNSSEDKILQFGSGMQFEITVKNEQDKEIYRYSDGKYFTQAIVCEEIKAGESIKWEDTWDMKNKDGEEISEGRYTATIEILPIVKEDPDLNRECFTTILEFEI